MGYKYFGENMKKFARIGTCFIIFLLLSAFQVGQKYSQTGEIVRTWSSRDKRLLSSLVATEYRKIEPLQGEVESLDWDEAILLGAESEQTFDLEVDKDVSLDIVGCPRALDYIEAELEEEEGLLYYRLPSKTKPLQRLLVEEDPGSFPDSLPAEFGEFEDQDRSDSMSAFVLTWNNVMPPSQVADLCDSDQADKEKPKESPGGLSIPFMWDEEPISSPEMELAGGNTRKGYSSLPFVAFLPLAFPALVIAILFVRSRMKSKVNA